MKCRFRQSAKDRHQGEILQQFFHITFKGIITAAAPNFLLVEGPANMHCFDSTDKAFTKVKRSHSVQYLFRDKILNKAMFLQSTVSKSQATHSLC